MTEFITRLTDAEKWFIDGMTNQFTGYISTLDYDAEPSDISTDNLFHIINFCLTRFTDVHGLQLNIQSRWETEGPQSDGIYQDYYDNFFDEYEDFFEGLAIIN
jgi:hypothetical protein